MNTIDNNHGDYIGYAPRDVHYVTGHSDEVVDPRVDLRDHSPTGFSWGYAGSGPAQLALAMLAHATGDDQVALQYYQDFKATRIARLEYGKPWVISRTEVLEWLGGYGWSPEGTMAGAIRPPMHDDYPGIYDRGE